MSTVLWANLLEGGAVRTDDSDKAALHRHTDALDTLGTKLGLGSFAELCDTTDLQFNMSDDDELPPGVESTNELMATKGAWRDLAPALKLLEALLSHLRQHRPRFGVFRNDLDDVIAELDEALTFAKTARAPDATFNFSVVM
ncbi:MAG: hypothetical protein JNG84_02085 [Archangium sp.]|nr:hypothetical protein [Archangium sp.]